MKLKNQEIEFFVLHRISFGGKSIDIKNSYDTASDFVEKIKKEINNSSIKYILEKISS